MPTIAMVNNGAHSIFTVICKIVKKNLAISFGGGLSKWNHGRIFSGALSKSHLCFDLFQGFNPSVEELLHKHGVLTTDWAHWGQ